MTEDIKPIKPEVDELFNFCQAVRLIYIICNDDVIAKKRIFEMITAVEQDKHLLPMTWVDINSPLVLRVIH